MSSRALHSTAAALLLATSLAAPIAAQAADALRVVRDPQTGELRGPTAAEAEAFKKAEAQLRASQRQAGPAARTAPAGQEIRHPDGSVELPLGDDSMLSSVVTLEKDGSLREHCLPAQEARALVQSSAKRPTAAAKPKAKVSL